jgi:hypothetical protein
MEQMWMHKQKVSWHCLNPINIFFLPLVLWVVVLVNPQAPIFPAHGIYRNNANAIAAIA